MVSLVGGALLVSGLLQVYFSYQSNRQALIDNQAEQADAAATVVKSQLGAITSRVTGDLLAISYIRCPSATTGACSPSRLEEMWQQRWTQLLQEVPDITEIWQLDHSGRQLLHLSRSVPGFVIDPRTELIDGQPKDWSHTAEFINSTVGLQLGVWYGPVSFPSSGSPASMPIAITNGVAILGYAPATAIDWGATVITIKLDFARQAIQVPLVRGADAFLVDSRGRALAGTDSEIVAGQSLAARPQVRAALTDQQSPVQEGTAAGVGPGDSKMLAAYSRVDPTGWLVFVEQPQAQAFAPLYGLIERLAFLLVVALLISVIASFLLARRMVQPIDALRRGAASVAGGDLSKPIDVRTGDELQALAEEFNRMTARLRDSYEGLEEKVQTAVVEIADKSRQLEAASRHKSEFLASMSHELRTPLNAIIGFSEVLLARMYGDLSPRQADYLEDVHSSGQHLLSLINDILDLSKIEAGRMEVQRSLFSLPEVLGSSLTVIRERASQQGILLETAIEPALGLIEADERKVRQILFNLLSNAVKFTPTGGRVTLSARQLGDAVEISVRDTGVGIAPADHERIFEEFQQVGGPAQEGTGLGLALTRKFVELQGGRIWLQSAQGKGSTFAFTLPSTPVGIEAMDTAEVAS